MTVMSDRTSDPLTTDDLDRYPWSIAGTELVEGTAYVRSRRAGGFTVEDLEDMAESMAGDGRRYELLDGLIVVSPAPRRVHQRVVTRLCWLLLEAAPSSLEVVTGPLDVDPVPQTRVQPDVLVLPAGDEESPVTRPLLVVEVLSPSNRGHDLVAKRARYERGGIPSYWIVDPDEPSVTVLQLGSEGDYVEVARASHDAVVQVDRPFPATVRPADLAC